jgi:hypothetical protein
MRWIDTLGGPHILLPKELLSSWRGTEGWQDNQDPLDRSDYARACRAGNSWLSMIPCGDGQALILGGDDGLVAWLPLAERAGGILMQWIYATDEEVMVDGAFNSLVTEALNGPDIEKTELLTGPSGIMRLFDSAEPGDEIRGGYQDLTLEPGRYLVRAAYVEDPRKFATVIRQISMLG